MFFHLDLFVSLSLKSPIRGEWILSISKVLLPKRRLYKFILLVAGVFCRMLNAECTMQRGLWKSQNPEPELETEPEPEPEPEPELEPEPKK